MRLVFVFRAFEFDARLFQFLFADTVVRPLFDRGRRCLLCLRGVEGVAVIGRVNFRQQLSLAHVLAFFHQHSDYASTDLESHVGRFRTLDRSTGGNRFGALHDGWSSDLNRHACGFGSCLGFLLARREQHARCKHNKREEDMVFLH